MEGASRPGNVPLLLMVVIVLVLPCAAVLRQVDVVKSAACRYSYWIEAKEGFHASTCHTSIDALESTRSSWSHHLLSSDTIQPTCVVTIPVGAVNITIFCCDPTWQVTDGDCSAYRDWLDERWYKGLPDASQKHDIINHHTRLNLSYASYLPEPCNSVWCPGTNTSDPYLNVCGLNMHFDTLQTGSTGMYACIMNRTAERLDDEDDFSAQTYLVQEEDSPCDLPRISPGRCHDMVRVASSGTVPLSLDQLLNQSLQYPAHVLTEGERMCMKCNVSIASAPAYWTFSGPSTAGRGIPLHRQLRKGAGDRILELNARPGLSVCGDHSQYLVIDKMSAQDRGIYTCMPSRRLRSEFVTPQAISVALPSAGVWNDVSIATSAVSGGAFLVMVIMALSACYIHRAEARRRRQNSYRSIGRSDDDITVSGAFGRQDTLDSARSPGRANPPQRSDSFAFPPSDQVDRGAATSTSADQLPNIHEVDSPAANWISQLVSQHQQLPLETNGNGEGGTASVDISMATPSPVDPAPSGRSTGHVSTTSSLSDHESEKTSSSRSDMDSPIRAPSTAKELINIETGPMGRDIAFQFGGHSLPEPLEAKSKPPTPLSLQSNDTDTQSGQPEESPGAGAVMVFPGQAQVARSAPAEGLFQLQRSASPSIQEPLSRPSSGLSQRRRSRKSSDDSVLSSPNYSREVGAAETGYPYAGLSGAVTRSFGGQPRPASALGVGSFEELDDIFSETSNEHSGFHSPPVNMGADSSRSRSFREFIREISNKNAGYRVISRRRPDRERRPVSAPPRDEDEEAGTSATSRHIRQTSRQGQAYGSTSPRSDSSYQGRYEIPPFHPNEFERQRVQQDESNSGVFACNPESSTE